MKLKTILLVGVAVIVFMVLNFLSLFSFLLYPFELIATILHELGHALSAVFTGGSVSELQVNLDGSGHCVSSGGWRPLVLSGGYLGSIVFGNVLFRTGWLYPISSKYVLLGLVVCLTFLSILWAASVISFLVMGAIAALLFFFWKKNWSQYLLIFIGGYSIVHILIDFVGPSSDARALAQEVSVFGQQGWMLIWFLIACLATVWNVVSVLRK